jgi:hypothetical protein
MSAFVKIWSEKIEDCKRRLRLLPGVLTGLPICSPSKDMFAGFGGEQPARVTLSFVQTPKDSLMASEYTTDPPEAALSTAIAYCFPPR